MGVTHKKVERAKKILYITPYFPEPNKKAGSKFTYNQIKKLVELGYDVDLVSITRFDKLDIENVQLICKNVFVFKRDNYLSYFNAFVKAFFQKQSLFLDLLPSSFKRQIRILLNKNYDRVFIEHSYMAIWFRNEFGNKYDDKLRIVMHNIEKDYFEYMYKNEKLNLSKLFYWLEYRFLFHNEDILLRNKNLKFLFLNKDNAKKYNGLFLPSFPFEVKNVKEYAKYDIGYIGFLGSQRNINALKFFLENIWPIILKNNKNITFCIAGRGLRNEDENYLKKFKNVYIIGEINKIENFYSNNKIIIVPILESIGVQTKLYEALSYLKPVVCTKFALNGMPFENNIHLFATNDIQKFANYCLLLLEKKEIMEIFKKNLISLEQNIKIQIEKVLKI
ncbi:glycosyltransferase [Hippea sp. KM1]|uniref:glycosyltransferase n=1 Tax=Hippea sp. KM1 TaxID=944481 RepID=UPI00046CC9D7|nr:glycosyltransferase [Hippea sp. KM1]